MTEALRKTKQRAEAAIAKINKWHSEINGDELNELTKCLITYQDFESGFFPWQTEKGTIKYYNLNIRLIEHHY